MRGDNHTTSSNQRAVIYCRVSSVRQVEEGHGLQSQESRCREYAASKGYAVEAVFPDGISGGGDFMKRPGMMALLAYLDGQKGENYVVIFDDLKRFARDTEFHIKLRREFAMRGARVECLNFKFEDTPEGRFIETILAAQGELERSQNGRQVLQKMKARLQAGYWCFAVPAGYRYAKTKEHGKLLVRDEPIASVLQDVFERLALGSLQTVTEAVRYLEDQPQWQSKLSSRVNYQTINDLLRRPVYAGYISMPKWDVPLMRGKHEGLVSLETWQKAQDRLDGKSYAPTRKDIRKDFPLRGFIECADCCRPLTGGWSRSRTGKRHAYYFCRNKACESYGKSIRKAQLEDDFAALLQSVRPTPTLIELFTLMFRTAWDQRLVQAGQSAIACKQKVTEIEQKIGVLLERIVEAETPTVIKAYETKIAGLEREKLIVLEKASMSGNTQTTFDGMFELALTFLKKAGKPMGFGRARPSTASHQIGVY